MDSAIETTQGNREAIIKIQEAIDNDSAATAMQLAHQQTQLYPNDPQSWIWLAIAQQALELLEESGQNFRKAIQLQPDNPEPYAYLGFVLAQQNRTKEAISQLEAATRLDSTNLKSLQLLGDLYCSIAAEHQELDTFKHGLNILEQCVQQAPHVDEFKSTLASWYLIFAMFEWMRAPEDDELLIPISRHHIETAVTYVQKAEILKPASQSIQAKIKETRKTISSLNKRKFQGRFAPGIMCILSGFLLLFSGSGWALPIILTGIAYFVALREPIYLTNAKIYEEKNFNILDIVYYNADSLGNMFTFYNTSFIGALQSYFLMRFILNTVALGVSMLILPLLTVYGFYKNYFSQRSI